MKKRTKTISLVLASVVLLIGVGCYLFVPNPFKIVDPADPRFNPSHFDYCDYSSHDAIEHAFSILFNPGMSEPEVDAILVDAGGAIKSYPPPEYSQSEPHNTIVHYTQPNKLCEIYLLALPTSTFVFDKETGGLKMLKLLEPADRARYIIKPNK